MAQWWERSPSTSLARVRFRDPASYVGWVCCWFSTLLWEVFLRILRFPPLLKNQHLQIPIRFWNARTLLNEFLWTSWCSVGKQMTFTFLVALKFCYLPGKLGKHIKLVPFFVYTINEISNPVPRVSHLTTLWERGCKIPRREPGAQAKLAHAYYVLPLWMHLFIYLFIYLSFYPGTLNLAELV